MCAVYKAVVGVRGFFSVRRVVYHGRIWTFETVLDLFFRIYLSKERRRFSLLKISALPRKRPL